MKIALTHGCFDILHVGHVRMFYFAARLGYPLIVSVAGDEHVKIHKGVRRPVNTQRDRIEVVRALRDVHAIFDDVQKPGLDPVVRMIRKLRPAVYVKGAEWQGRVPEEDVIEELGGRIVYAPMIAGYSTTNVIAKVSA